jgi:hypothetical protein
MADAMRRNPDRFTQTKSQLRAAAALANSHGLVCQHVDVRALCDVLRTVHKDNDLLQREPPMRLVPEFVLGLVR